MKAFSNKFKMVVQLEAACINSAFKKDWCKMGTEKGVMAEGGYHQEFFSFPLFFQDGDLELSYRERDIGNESGKLE